jgi:hypothetical protein
MLLGGAVQWLINDSIAHTIEWSSWIK